MSKAAWRSILLTVTLAALAAGLAPPAFAQSQATTGLIEGTVVDQSDAQVPGATVTLRNTATNFERVVVTDSGGRFRAPLMPLGPYRVTVALEGFATQVQEGLDLGVGQTLSLSFKLSLSAVEQEIVVTAEAPLIEGSRTEGTVRINDAAVENLPNNGRNFLDFTKLTPGVSVVQGPDGDELSITGQKGINNNISVDGADFNNPFFGEQRGGQRPPFTFNLDAVKEVVVVADGAPAEFGRSSGGFVNVITKSGTNDTQGTAHLFYKNDSLSSAPAKPGGGTADKGDSSQAQGGFTLGGPLKTDRVFYFVAGDIQRGDQTKQTDPNRIEQRVVDYFASIGSPNENGPIERTNDAEVALAKVDWNASESNLLTLRYAYTNSEQVNGTFDVDSWGRSANSIEQDYSHAGTGSLISALSGSLLNEFRFQYAKEWRPRPYNGPDVTGQSRPLPDTAFDFGRAYRFGEPFFIPVKYNDDRIQLTDNVSWLFSNHSVKAGVEYNEVASAQTFIGFANGRYIFSSTDGFLNYVRNPAGYLECQVPGTTAIITVENGVCPAGTNIVGPVLLYLQQAGANGLTVEQAGTQTIRQKEPAAFVQDTWQPRDNLTIDFGLRWEAEMEPDPITPPSEVFYAPFIGTTRNGQRFPSNGKVPSDNDMFQPRFGLAWDVQGDGKSLIRANAGLFYARIPALTLASSRSTNGTRGQTLFRSSAASPFLGPVPVYPNLIPQSQIGDPFLPDVFVFDEDFQNPRTTSASVSYEREVKPDLSVLIKYNYAKTDHITRFINGNDPLLGSPWSSGLPPGGANGINTLTVIESTARSKYEGVTLGLNKRLSHNFQGQLYYTYSKDKSDDDNERDPFSFRYAKITDLDAEYSWSDRDQRHRLNAWVLWQAPHGINVNARYAYRSAQPQSITASGAIANTPQDRCSAVTPAGGCTADATVTRRNLGRKDNKFDSLDLRVSKEFSLGSVTLEPIIDIFNLFDNANFRRPEVTSLIFNFDGTVQSGAGEPRQIQLGLRVLF